MIVRPAPCTRPAPHTTTSCGGTPAHGKQSRAKRIVCSSIHAPARGCAVLCLASATCCHTCGPPVPPLECLVYDTIDSLVTARCGLSRCAVRRMLAAFGSGTLGGRFAFRRERQEVGQSAAGGRTSRALGDRRRARVGGGGGAGAGGAGARTRWRRRRHELRPCTGHQSKC